MKKTLTLLIVLVISLQPVFAGLLVVRSSGIAMTGADGIQVVNPSGIAMTGADGFLVYDSNGISMTGADGIPMTGADGIAMTGADGVTYAGVNGITMTGADGIAMTGADGITMTGADGITMTGVDGTIYRADSIVLRNPSGIAMTGADNVIFAGSDGVGINGADGVRQTGADGISMTGADGIAMTGADGVTLTGVDGISLRTAEAAVGIGSNGTVFSVTPTEGTRFSGIDGIAISGASGVNVSGATAVTLANADIIDAGQMARSESTVGLQSVDPEFITMLNDATDDSSLNAVVVYHQPPTDSDLDNLRAIGITGGTRFRQLPMIYVSATKTQIIAVSRLSTVRSIYGNRTLTLNSDSYLKPTGLQRVAPDADLRAANGGPAISGRGGTVAVLDTGIDSSHPDLAGQVVQNVRLADSQSVPAGFLYPIPVENLANTDPVSGHGTFVAGIIAGTGANSAGRYAGAAPGAKLVGLSAGDLNLIQVLSGFDWLLEKGTRYNVKVVNCSFSANTLFDFNDPVNIATQTLTGRGVTIVFSAGNGGPGNGTINPYAAAPWVIGVGATDPAGKLAAYSSRGVFGDALRHPSLVAPGTNLISLRAAGTISVEGLSGADSSRLTTTELANYTTASGTSFSAPQVAATVALMLEARPTLSTPAIADILARTATPMPRYYFHEAGAGMLNVHAAVLEAKFVDRRMGLFRSTLSRSGVKFVTTPGVSFNDTVSPGTQSVQGINIPTETVEASFNMSWGMLNINDLSLRITNAAGITAGQSNLLNLPGITGKFERVVLRDPAPGNYLAVVQHSTAVGTSQQYFGGAEITRALLSPLTDAASLSAESAVLVKRARISGIFAQSGTALRPAATATRLELAETFVRAGLVPQYLAGSAMYNDVRQIGGRGVVESIQNAPVGRLIFDAAPGTSFRPYDGASRLVLTIALVRALSLESQASSAVLPATVADSAAIPMQYRGHVAIALQRGLIQLDAGNNFQPTRSANRLDSHSGRDYRRRILVLPTAGADYDRENSIGIKTGGKRRRPER